MIHYWTKQTKNKDSLTQAALFIMQHSQHNLGHIMPSEL